VPDGVPDRPEPPEAAPGDVVGADPQGLPARLKEARRTAGLSQAEAGGGELSASYVSLLESGRRRPTRAALEVLADRLGCTVDYLVHGQDQDAMDRARLALDYADLALRNGEQADALTQLEALGDGVAALPEPDRWRYRTLHARALERSGRLEEAVEELEGLRADALAAHRYGEHLQLTVDAVRCYHEAGDLSYALDVGERALDAVARQGLVGTERHAELASTVLGLYFARGDLVRAEAVARAVLDALGDEGSPRARAAVHWNASLVAERRDDLPTALSLAERALAVYAEGDDARALARLRVAYGWLLLRSLPPRPEAARDQLRASLDALRDVGSEIDLAYCETELARAELLLDRPREAMALADAALERLGDTPRLETAFSTLVRARAVLALGEHDEAVAAYRTAAQTLGGLRLSRDAANAWRELADSFTRLGMLEDAAMAYQQALTDAGVRAVPDLSYTQDAADRHRPG
jgi:tetratricopeptide (TPR) repeat protein